MAATVEIVALSRGSRKPCGRFLAQRKRERTAPRPTWAPVPGPGSSGRITEPSRAARGGISVDLMVPSSASTVREPSLELNVRTLHNLRARPPGCHARRPVKEGPISSAFNPGPSDSHVFLSRPNLWTTASTVRFRERAAPDGARIDCADQLVIGRARSSSRDRLISNAGARFEAPEPSPGRSFEDFPPGRLRPPQHTWLTAPRRGGRRGLPPLSTKPRQGRF